MSKRCGRVDWMKPKKPVFHWPKSPEAQAKEDFADAVKALILTGKNFSLEYVQMGDRCKCSVKVEPKNEA